jgi:hypothetical protein
MGGLTDPSWFTQASRDRGHVVHMAAEGVFTGQPVSVAPAYQGYAEALAKGYSTLAFQAIWVEQRLALADVTGRPDAVGWLTTRTGKLWPGPVIVDVKSGPASVAHGVQLSFYEMLADACGARDLLPLEYRDLPWQRVGFYVTDRGTYRIRPYDDPNDILIAQAILDLTRWRVAHGLFTCPADDDPDFTEELAHGRRAGDGAGPGQRAAESLPTAGA